MTMLSMHSNIQKLQIFMKACWESDVFTVTGVHIGPSNLLTYHLSQRSLSGIIFIEYFFM